MREEGLSFICFTYGGGISLNQSFNPQNAKLGNLADNTFYACKI